MGSNCSFKKQEQMMTGVVLLVDSLPVILEGMAAVMSVDLEAEQCNLTAN